MTMIRHSFLIIFATMLIFIFHSCGDGEKQNVDDFDRRMMLQNIGNNVILKAYQEFSLSTEELEQSAQAFAGDISTANLDALREKWIAAKRNWKSAEMFDLGPVEEMALETSIDNWPTNTNAVETAIENATVIDKDYISFLGSSSKGLPAIEYLLFDKEIGEQAVLEALQNDGKRLQFLVALTQNVNELAGNIYDAWNSTGGNYVNEFSSSTGKDVGSSTNMLANQLIILVEDIKNNKIGIPLGKKSMGTLLPKNAESWRSETSLDMIKENLNSVQDVFTGKAGSGFDDYLDVVNAQYNGTPLSQVINTQISTIKSSLDDIDLSLVDALETENDKVETAYTELQKLVVYLKTDMMSSLGLLVTYSDNDGD